MREDDGQMKAILSSEEHSVESILDVMLGQVDEATSRVSMMSQLHAPMEHPTKLHGLRGHMWDSGGVHGGP